jgi:putative oxidoreductase
MAHGFLGPIGPALMISVMIVAAVTVHWENWLFAQANGIELPLLYATGALAVALSGFGPYSLDALLGLAPVWTPKLVGTALAVGVIGGFANLMVRRRAPHAHGA